MTTRAKGTSAIVFAALLVLFLDTRVPAWLQRTEPFLLAVLRRDGIAVPFAVFDGRRWEVAWPGDIRRELPISVADIPESWWRVKPPPTRMALWSDGRRRGDVALTGVSTTMLMCQPRAVIRTDYKADGAAPPPMERPYPKDGVLVYGDVTVRAIERVVEGSPDANRIASLIPKQFDESEREAANRFYGWRHPFKPADRAKVPIVVEAVYRAETDTKGWTAHFVEAVRQYPAGPGDRPGCGLAAFASGWVLTGPKDESRVFLSGRIAYCDRNEVVYMLPLGLVTANERIYWVFQMAGYESEQYEVVHPTSREVESHALYFAGGCR